MMLLDGCETDMYVAKASLPALKYRSIPRNQRIVPAGALGMEFFKKV